MSSDGLATPAEIDTTDGPSEWYPQRGVVYREQMLSCDGHGVLASLAGVEDEGAIDSVVNLLEPPANGSDGDGVPASIDAIATAGNVDSATVLWPGADEPQCAQML